MPKRSNFFQDVVGIVHRHLAPASEIEESAMLTNRHTGDEAEVDVVMRDVVAGYPVVVCVEVRGRRRPQSVEWVQQEHGKHLNLETTTLVLASESGFTAGAKRFAEAEGVLLLTPALLTDDDMTKTVLRDYEVLYPRGFSTRLDRTVLSLGPGVADRVLEVTNDSRDLCLFDESGNRLPLLSEAVQATLSQAVESQMESLASIDPAGSPELAYQVEAAPWELALTDQSQMRVPHLRVEQDGQQDRYVAIEKLQLFYVVRITLEKPLFLKHRRFKDTVASFGTLEIGDRVGTIVMTESPNGISGTFRERVENVVTDIEVKHAPGLMRDERPPRPST